MKGKTPHALRLLLGRELLVAWRQPMDFLAPVLFFVLVVIFFPLALGPDRPLLRELAPGAIWIAAVLAAMLSLGRLFRPDAEAGSLDQLLLCPPALTLLVLTKIVAHWLTVGLPMLLCAAPLALFLGLQYGEIPTLLASFAMGSAALFLIGAVIEALTISTRSGGVLLALLLLPLNIPVMIFGATALQARQLGFSAGPHLSILAGILLISLVLGPWATATALRISVD